MIRRPGFTAIELLITIGILGILAGISIPSYAHAQKRQLVRQTAAELADVIRQAQTKAITRFDGLDVKVSINGNVVTVSNTSRTILEWSAPTGITLSNATLNFDRKKVGRINEPNTTITVNNGTGQISTVVVTTAGTITTE